MNDESGKENDNEKIGIQRLLSPKQVAEILGVKSPPAKPGAYDLLAPQGGVFMSPLKGTCLGSKA